MSGFEPHLVRAFMEVNNLDKSVAFPLEINSQYPGTSQDMLFFFDRNTHKGNRNQFSNFVSGCKRILVNKASYYAALVMLGLKC